MQCLSPYVIIKEDNKFKNIMLLGFSSGTAYKNIPSTSEEIVDACLEIGCNAIEIFAANNKELLMLKENIDKIKKKLGNFDYVSLHSPCGKLSYKNNEKTYDILQVLQEAYDKFNCKSLVVHPNNVKEWSVFDDFSFTIAIENLSNDVPFFNVDQLNRLFIKHPKFKMVLDVSHAYKNDPNFKLTKELINNFSDRIVHIHLSGHEIMHEPLFKTKQIKIIKNIPKNLPIILEGDCQTIENMKREYLYVKKNLNC